MSIAHARHAPAPPALAADLGPLRLRTCRHGPMLFMPHDAYVGRSLDLYGEFSQQEVAILLQLAAPGDVVVDVGANIGALTVPLAQRVGGAGAVLAIEPQRVIHQLLCANVALNAATNVLAERCALAAREGTLRMPPLDYARANNFGGVSVEEGEGGVRVPARTLDSFGLSRCNLIKIDAEGSERDVLEGSRATIGRHRPAIYAENDRAANSPALIAWLQGMNYRLYWHLPLLFSASNFLGTRDNVFPGVISVNVLALPAERTQRVEGFEPVLGPEDTWQAARDRRQASPVPQQP